MTPEELEHRAREAQRWLNEPLLAEALSTVRFNALLALAEVDATDTKTVLKYQAIAAVTQEVLTSLEAIIHQGGEPQTEQDGEPPA